MDIEKTHTISPVDTQHKEIGTMITIHPSHIDDEVRLRKGLKQRHIQMIALAGTIGTGLFLGSGRAIANSGPLGALIAYTTVGFLVAGMVMCISEMSALLPLSGGIIRHSEYFFDPALSFAVGWNGVLGSFIGLPAEIVAAAVIVQFWLTVNNAIWISCFAVLLLLANVVLVRVYGEMEFGFSMMKIMLIIGFNLMAIVIACGGAPNKERSSFSFWHDPGPFVQYLDIPGSTGQFLGTLQSFTQAVYSYASIESFTVIAAETQNPKRNIPKAAKRTVARVMILFIFTIFMIGLLVPSNDPDLLRSTGTAAQSPFVIVANRAGINTVPSIVNAGVLLSAWSAASSILFGMSRTLFGLAQERHAPAVFRRVTSWGVPYAAVIACFSGFLLAYMVTNSTATVVFSWLQHLVSVGNYIAWIIICGVYLRFYYAMKQQGISRDELPWQSPFQPYTAWICFISFTILLMVNGFPTFLRGQWNATTFISSYINIVIVLCLYISYKLVKKTTIVPLSEIPIRELIEHSRQSPDSPEVKHKNKIVKWVNFLWS